jgi:uncharacterized alkaline shock family protein YloU
MFTIVNRLITSVFLVVVGLLALMVAVTPGGVASALAFQLQQVQVDAISVQHLIIAIVGIGLTALCGFVLRLEWKPTRPHAIRLIGPGSTELATESIVDGIRQDVTAIDHVRQANPMIHGRGNQVDVNLEVRTEPGVDVPTKAQEIEQVVRDSISRRGLKIGRVRVKIVVGRGVAAPSSEAEN